MSKSYITVQDAAKQAGVGVTGVNNWVYSNKFKSIKRYGRRLIDAASFNEFLATRNAAPMMDLSSSEPEITAVAVRPADGPANVFSFNGAAVRTVMVDGEPCWVAKDVAEILGYTWAGAASIKHVPDEWKGVNSVLTPRGEQEMATLTEQGLYFFLGRSDKPLALPFQKWIAGEVLPAIRKTGGYSVVPQPDALVELNRFAGMMNQVIPAVTGRIIEINQELDAIKAAQAALNPNDLAVEAERIRTEREVELGKLRGTLSKLVGMIVDAAQETEHLPPNLSFAKRYQGTWMAIHRSIGLNRIDDYKTTEQYDQAIASARDFLAGVKADGRPAMRLL